MNLLELLYATAVTALIYLAALGLGRIVLRVLHIDESGLMQRWVEIIVGLGVLSVATLLIGLIGLLQPLLFVLLLLPLAVVGGGRLLGTSRTEWHQLFQLGDSRLDRFLNALLLFITVSSALWILLTHALLPPYEWDEVAYHLPLPQLYVQAGRIIYVPFIVESNWPLNYEMLFAIALLLRSDLATHLLMLGQAGLVALGLLLLARRYLDARVGFMAMALFMTVPLVKRLAGTAMIDVGMGLYVMAALYTFERWREARQGAWLLLCAMICGVVAGTKLSGAAFPLLLGALLLWVERREPGQALRTLLRFGLISFLVVAPWYARSVYFTGNPVWPFAYEFFGGRDWDALGSEYFVRFMLDELSLPVQGGAWGLAQASYYLLFEPKGMGGYRGGIGLILPVAGLLALLRLHRAPPFLRHALFVCGGFYLLWFALLSLQLRFLLPIVPLLALASAYLFDWLLARMPAPALRWALAGALLLLLLWEWPWAYQDERTLFTMRLPYLQGEQTREMWLAEHIDSLPLFTYANTHLPPDSHILLLPYENRAYYLERRYTWGHPISQRIIPFERFDRVEELAAALQARGITHVIDVPTWVNSKLRHWEHDRALMLELQHSCGAPLFQHEESVLYALTPCTAGEP